MTQVRRYDSSGFIDELGMYVRWADYDALRQQLASTNTSYGLLCDRLETAEQQLAEMRGELRSIAEAKRFDRERFDDDTSFADWAQSRARHALAPTSQPSRGKCDHQGAACYMSTGSNIAKCSRCGAEFDMRQLPYGWPDVKPAPDCAQPEQSEGHPPGVVMDSNGAVTEWFNSLGKGQPELITNPTVAAGGVVVVAQPERQGADTIRVLCDNGIALAKRRDEMTGGREGAEHHGDYEKLFREIKRALRPSPPQDDIVAGLREMHEFLRGAGTLNGCAFGERPIGATGNYWWRKPLGIVIDRAIAALGEKGAK